MENIKDLLEEIHFKTAEHMLNKLSGGNVEAKDLAVIIKFLKDNNVDTDTLNDVSQSDHLNTLLAAAQNHLESNQH